LHPNGQHFYFSCTKDDGKKSVMTEIEISTFNVAFSTAFDENFFQISMVPLPEDRTMLYATHNPAEKSISYFSYTSPKSTLNY
jgi:hypothetical protein